MSSDYGGGGGTSRFNQHTRPVKKYETSLATEMKRRGYVLKNGKWVRPSEVVKKKTDPTTTVVTGGASVAGGSSSSKPTKQKYTWQKDIGTGPDIYSPIMGQLAKLQEGYAALKSAPAYKAQTYTAGKAPTADAYAADANARANSEVSAKVAAMGGREAAANAAYEQARNAAYLENAKNMAALQAGQSQDVGRIQAMAANMGMGTGFGNLANSYGVQSDYATRMAQANADTSAAVNSAALQAAAERAGIAGDVASARAGLPARQYELQNEAFDRALAQYNADEGRNVQVWGQNEQNRQQEYQNYLDAMLAALSGQSSTLNASASMLQDMRNFANTNAWANKNFNYNAYNDDRAYGLNKSNLALQQQNASDANYWNSMQYGLNAAGQTASMRQNLLQLRALYPNDPVIQSYLAQMGLL